MLANTAFAKLIFLLSNLLLVLNFTYLFNYPSGAKKFSLFSKMEYAYFALFLFEVVYRTV